MIVPRTDRDDTTEVLHGHTIADPYRWLEDADSQRTRDWVERQRKYAEEYLAQIPARGPFTALMNRLLARPRFGTPWRDGHWWLRTSNDLSLIHI